jgi:trimethylamine---corrinoid protein Co-methyltransferase
MIDTKHEFPGTDNALGDGLFRAPLSVNPVKRLSDSQVRCIHEASLSLLMDPGIRCFSKKTAEIYRQAGCSVEERAGNEEHRVLIPASCVTEALKTVPSKVVLGARNREKRLLLEADKARVYFGTGSETNIFLESRLETFVSTENGDHTMRYPVYQEERGSAASLAYSAKLCDSLENVDFFIRNVNLQDPELEDAAKDVNVFFASLLYMTKHVQAGLTEVDRLQDVLSLAEIVAGGKDALVRNPLISFIACPVKSPLQMVKDTSEKVIKIAESGLPLVLSSSPQGGSTAPVQEEGIISQINAEILAGIVLTQLVNPGTPVLYGAVPVRARLDNLHDFYGAPEFIHYNIGCAQMARHYGIPCYSSAGVGDAKRPGMQAVLEKFPAQLMVAAGGPQYIHYAFGLLDRTNIFCPLQAVLDNASISLVKDILRTPCFSSEDTQKAADEIRKTAVASGIFARGIRKQLRRGVVSGTYEFADDTSADNVLANAQQKLEALEQEKGNPLDPEVIEAIYKTVPGLLPLQRFTPRK